VWGQKAEDAEHPRHQPIHQVEDGRLAAARPAERQDVDRPADRPFHVIVEEFRGRCGVTRRIGPVEGLDFGPRDRIAH
jgi:hypothetical protein